ncbi:type IV pilus assembly protein PilY1 [Pseudomonas citronellolis]|uniref:pilus assembly protein n=1 Tax=Pseudomonas citronellolis TaxID=53408 RepID=UPI00209F1D89|nr:PilC/PilY family type IV pilus protein [Pseudomonas citronellolis]MCP1643406.1 type IV pilus assembly protein PilY1 [Pseudomonas citronellolis]MCP1666229.1 type IV pilus assembly protein PilY1 [Pseudomonas citronellolis]MCP1699643.1 type IV pilus assembly protein PilY1 [Pseudomonas citronellolis]MCP1703976.1 type IV pilus assembly protein PilY1 [Pseudomonas citronellolis]MCP1797918.1 type IV pilus assembly protein PilY1 [Pseudomonas citronellolis]
MSLRRHYPRLVLGLAAPWLIVPASADKLHISQQPLFLSQTVAPNLILTMDSSGSMWDAYVPDDIDRHASTRRAKAASYNAMYYNPRLSYRVPKQVTFSNGQLTVGEYPVSQGGGFDFTRVRRNGFDERRQTVDLANEYRVTWSYSPDSSSDSNTALHPERDFKRSVSLSSNGQTWSDELAPGLTLKIKRTGRDSCEAHLDGRKVACSGRRSNYTVDLINKGVPAYYYRFNSTQPGCSASATDNDNCYKLVKVSANSGPNGEDERENFAIWYAFYRNRALATQSAANLAFNSLPESIRLTWQDLNGCSQLNGQWGCNGISYSGGNLLRPFAKKHRADFFYWLSSVRFSGGTPLRQALDRAGKFIADEDGPAYDFEPGGKKEPKFTCRPSYHLMMTDGLWNGRGGSVGGNIDANGRTLPDGTRYAARSPFKDGARDTLADLAFHYWATDARTDLANELKPYVAFSQADATRQYWDPRNNPATWQHLVTFTMGLGLGQSLLSPQWSGGTFEGAGYQGLANGSIAWPPASSDHKNNVYDLWHAAINSRGEFFSAEDPQEMVDAFASILSRIANRTASAARPAVAAGEVKDQAHVYVASFSSEDWSGDLVKYLQPANAGRQQLWSARALLDGRKNPRRILMGKGKSLVDFAWSNLDRGQRRVFNQTLSGDQDSRGEARVQYLAGKRDLEGGEFRRRGGLLGDIVNSAPLLVTAPSRPALPRDRLESPGNDGLSSRDNAYSEFKAAQASRRSMIYVGANDGMLHAFDAETGEEVFAFVPRPALAGMYRLTDPRYTTAEHRYLVDGPLVAEDVFFDGAWRTVLVGGLGAGGRALFALDVTDPQQPKLLWEIEGGAGPFARLGHTLARPVITRLHSGQWAVLAANGYDGLQDMAVLYLIDIATGSLLRELNVSQGGDAANGLSSPRAADMDGDGIVDHAYAGDLLGNLWRFDLYKAGSQGGYGGPESASASDYRVGLAGRPLFRARDASNNIQPITAAPWLVRHPSGQGVLALLGTGKYFEVHDAEADTSRAMSLYGIWDRLMSGEQGGNDSTVTRNRLQAQTFSKTTDSYRSLSNNPLAWAPAAQKPGSGGNGKHGWLLDLPQTGEQVVADPASSGRLALFATLTPNADPCQDGVSTWLLALNPLTGGAPLTDALDYNNDGVVDAQDRVGNDKVAGVLLPGGLGGASLGFDLSSGLGVAHGSEGAVRFYDGIRPGRQSWRQMEASE